MEFTWSSSLKVLLTIAFLIQLLDQSEAQRNNTCMVERYKCKNGGLCITRAGAKDDYVCSCPAPYCGRTCSSKMPDCIEEDFNCEKPEHKCENEGRCIVFPLSGYLCSCKQGYCGNRCTNRFPNCL